MDEWSHTNHQKIMADNDGNLVSLFLPGYIFILHRYMYSMKLTFQAILFPLVSCSKAIGKSPRS